jgi:hypothetical protein
MLALRRLSQDDILFVLSKCSFSLRDRASIWRSRDLVAFAATEGDTLEGLAIAESKPRLLHVSYLKGSDDACHLLLQRLILLAGERDVSVACRADRAEVRQFLEGEGFELLAEGRPREDLVLYGLDQGGDPDEG